MGCATSLVGVDVDFVSARHARHLGSFRHCGVHAQTNPEWSLAGFYMLGIIGGFRAAVFGLIDWLAIPPATRAGAIGARAWPGQRSCDAVVRWFLASRWDDPAAPSN